MSSKSDISNKEERGSGRGGAVARLVEKFGSCQILTTTMMEAAGMEASSSSSLGEGEGEGERRKKKRKREETMLGCEGISLKWFEELYEEEEMRKREMGMREMVEVVRRITVEREESIVEMLRRTEPKYVQEVADVYISYSGECPVKGMMETLNGIFPSPDDTDSMAYGEHDDLFIWMDVFVLNLHESESGSGSENENKTKYWMDSIQNVINKIGRVALILTPWYNLRNLVRSWCLWELHCATINENTKLEIVVSHSQRKSLQKSLRRDTCNIIVEVGKIDVTKAKAWNKQDQEVILNVAQAATSGSGTLHERVAGPVRKWMTKEATTLIKKLMKDGYCDPELPIHTCEDVGRALGKLGLFDEQEVFCRKSVELYRKVYGNESSSTAMSLEDFARFLRRRGKYEEAIPIWREILDIRKKTREGDSLDISFGMFQLAWLSQKLGQFTEAEVHIRNSLEIERKSNGNNSWHILIYLSHLASILNDAGKLDEAEDACREAFEIMKRSPGRDSITAFIFRIQAEIDLCKNRLDEAESNARQSVTMNKDDEESYLILAKVLRAKKQNDEASAMGKRCLEMYEKMHGPNHPETIKAKTIIEGFGE